MTEAEPSEKVDPPSDKTAEPSAVKETTPAKKPAPGKKPAPELKPFVDNGDGTVTDPNTGLIWKKDGCLAGYP